MKKYFLLLALVSIASTGFSQVKRNAARKSADSSSTSMSREDRMERRDMIKELNLSQEQKVQFRDATKAQKDAKEAIENDSSLSADEKKTKLKELRLSYAEKMKTILTPTQWEQFKKMRKDKKED